MSEVELPAGWAFATLGDLGTWTSGGTPSRGEDSYYGLGVPWVKTGDLCDGPIVDVPETITALGLKNSSAKKVPTGSLLVAMYGATIGRLGLLTFEAATNQACAALICDNGSRDFVPYTFQFLLSQRDELRKVGKGGAQPNISQGLLKAYEIPLPPLNEQKRIVAKLESLQGRSRRARAALDAAAPLLEKLRQSILAAAFRGDLTADWRAKQAATRAAAKAAGKTALNALAPAETAAELLQRIRTERRAKWEAAELAKLTGRGKAPKDDAWKSKYKPPAPIDPATLATLPQLPDGWCWASVDELLADGPSNGYSPKSDAAGHGTLTLKLSATTKGECILNAQTTKRTLEKIVSEQFWLEPGDILVQRANTLDYVGVSAIFDGPAQTYIYPDLMMRLRPISLINPRLMWRALSSHSCRAYMRERATGTSGNMPKINGETVRSCPIALPPMLEQQALEGLINSSLRTVLRLQATLGELDSLGHTIDLSILAAAFRGELVPQVPNDEPAAAMLARLRSAATSASAETAASVKSKTAKPPSSAKSAKRINVAPTKSRAKST
jgi:type I restriction enzyme, S subunit